MPTQVWPRVLSRDDTRSNTSDHFLSWTGLNLNCGCPSTKVSERCFGASLMLKQDVVAECLLAIKKAGLPSSIKCRIGVNDLEGYDFMSEFVESIYSKTGTLRAHLA